jgi:uncharacterized membrane protein
MKELVSIGRIVYAIPLAFFALGHFSNAPAMAGMVPNYFPGGGVVWVYITGAALAAAAVSIILNKMTQLSGLLLAIMLFIFVFVLHLPGAIKGDQLFIAMAMKDLGMAAGALMISGMGTKK